MGLEDIYQQNVNKNPINQAGISSGIPATRERDPQLIKPQINVQNVGLEQALKELLNGTKSTDNKS